MRHTRNSTPDGPDYCIECSDDSGEWRYWPCAVVQFRYGSR